MSNFQLSKQADPNKIFLTKFSELEGRLDPHFYKLIFKNIENEINLSGFDVLKLKELFEINRGGSPRPINRYFTNDKNGINWIKIGDTKGIDKYIYTTKQKITLEGVKFSRMVTEGDFILSNSMSFGRPFIMKTTGCIHDGWLLFRPTTNKASKDYLHTILSANFMYKLFKKQTIGGVVENLNIDLVKHIKIPIPPKNIQVDIVAKMDKAYQDKQVKETQAQQLLDGIDTYLLGELGIDLPKQTDNSLEARIFTKKLSDITGGRLDADYCRPLYKDIENALNNSNYKVKNIVDISDNIFQGVGRKSTTNITYVLLKVKNIAKNNEIKFNNVEYVDLENDNKVLKEGDIISPFIGEAIKQYKFSVFPKLPQKYVVDNNTGVIRLLPNVNPLFISAFLMSFYGKQQINRLLGGGGVPFIGAYGIKKIKTPLPPLEKQNQIAEHISKIRENAKQLQTEAKIGLAQAKTEVETMILGSKV